MTLSNKLEMTTNELLGRGWTRGLIKRFLPRPDGCVAVDHWANFRGQDTYATIKIWNIEHSEEFGHAFKRSWRRRKAAETNASSSEAVLDILRNEPHPVIPPRSVEQVRRDTALAAAAGAISAARARGYRTPHG